MKMNPVTKEELVLMKRKFNHYLGDEPPSVDLEENYMDPEALNMQLTGINHTEADITHFADQYAMDEFAPNFKLL